MAFVFNHRLKAAIFLVYETQAECAAELGISDGLLSMIVRGRRKPSKGLSELIAKKLAVSESEIFATDG